MLERIIVGVDGSDASYAATTVAGWIASRQGSRLRLVSVIEEPPPFASVRREEQAERASARAFYTEALRAAATRLQRRGIPSESDLRSGNEASGLLEAAVGFDADLIAIGHAGHSGVWGSGLGATAARVAQASTSSVLVARSGATEVSRLVVGYDGSPDAIRAVELAAGIVERDGAALVVAASSEAAAQQDPRYAIESLRRRVGASHPWRIEILEGDPAAALIRLTRNEAHDLVCLGAHGQRHPWAPGMGPVAQAVLERASGSVLLVRSPAEALTARRLMRSHPVTISPETPVSEAATRLLELGVKSLPVIDPDGHPVGILTLGDLLRRAGFGLRHSLSPALGNDELKEQLARLLTPGAVSGTVMSRDVATARPAAPVAELLDEMSRRKIKRLLIVDEVGKLVGIVSRSDVLRALAGAADSRDLPVRRAVTGSVARDVMRLDIATVGAATPAADVVRAVLGSGVGRVAVVDGEMHPIGVVAGRDLLQLATAETRAHLVGALVGQSGRLEAFLADIRRRPDRPPVAADLMRRDVVSVDLAAPLDDVLRLMMSKALKRILVVNAAGVLAGVIDRADVVRALAASMGQGSSEDNAPRPSA